MNNITKYNLKSLAIAACGLLLLFSMLSYLVAPGSESFEFNSINPIGFLEGVIFALGFGLGFPVWLSVIAIGLVSLLMLMAFLWIARKVIK